MPPPAIGAVGQGALTRWVGKNTMAFSKVLEVSHQEQRFPNGDGFELVLV